MYISQYLSVPGKLIPSGCNVASREVAISGVAAGADEASL